jgi:hypothetical protein
MFGGRYLGITRRHGEQKLSGAGRDREKSRGQGRDGGRRERNQRMLRDQDTLPRPRRERAPHPAGVVAAEFPVQDRGGNDACVGRPPGFDPDPGDRLRIRGRTEPDLRHALRLNRPPGRPVTEPGERTVELGERTPRPGECTAELGERTPRPGERAAVPRLAGHRRA